MREMSTVTEDNITKIEGTITCDSPNEYLEKWDGNLTVKSQKNKDYTFNAG